MSKLTKKEFEAFKGLDMSYEIMDKQIKKIAPSCHFTKMDYQYGWEGVEDYWECSHCGHTREVK